MSVPYVPFPRYENILVAGDTAAEVLGALKIYAKGLVGGEIPSMELLHPAEKPLECISCMLADPKAVFAHAVKKIGADYVLLEDNGIKDFNPVAAKETFEAQGIKVKVLDVKGDVEDVLRRAGAMFGEARQAERVITERRKRLEALKGYPVTKNLRGVFLLGIRSPIKHESYVFSVAPHSGLNALLKEAFGTDNLLRTGPEKDMIEGVQELGDIGDLIALRPDFIALTGDAAACEKVLREYFKEHPEKKKEMEGNGTRVIAAPYFCHCLAWRSDVILEAWADALG